MCKPRGATCSPLNLGFQLWYEPRSVASSYSGTSRLFPLLTQLLVSWRPLQLCPHLCTLMPSTEGATWFPVLPTTPFHLDRSRRGISQDLKIRVPYALASPSLLVTMMSLFCMLNITETYLSATRHQKSFSSHCTRQSFKRNLIELKLFVFYESRFIYLGQNRDILVNLKFTASFIANHPGARAVWLPEL